MNMTTTNDVERDKPRDQFNLFRVLTVTLIAAVLCGGSLWFFGLNDGWAKLQALWTPPLIPAQGTITFAGQPLTRGMIITEPVNGRWKGSVGFIDEKGQFEFKTDINGDYVRGAYPGVHKVIVQVSRNDGRFGAAAPPSLVPDRYTTFATTPLVVEISRSPDTNQFSLSLEGDETHQPETPAAGQNDQPRETTTAKKEQQKPEKE